MAGGGGAFETNQSRNSWVGGRSLPRAADSRATLSTAEAAGGLAVPSPSSSLSNAK